MKTNTIIQEEILFFLYHNKYFNKRHTPISNVCNKLSQIPCKHVKNELKNLYKLKMIRFKKTQHGTDVYLNVKMKKEIENIISEKLQSWYSL
ncbi:hypothetical protein [Methanobrevibacter sp.]|uniref:hypothetical protein n=1 Tax=Methanobrevibacter sp. TaxID=66852 RepID=UPI0025FAD271|nr:hypothetical protein [Methanobrevibacter sp.]MBR4447227.1 hypothetical protein [Methanobrevibacter sp.]